MKPLSRAVLGVSALVLPVVSGADSPPAFTLVDLTDDYARFYERTTGSGAELLAGLHGTTADHASTAPDSNPSTKMCRAA